MKYGEFKQNLESWWLETNDRLTAQKDSQGVLILMMHKYDSLTEQERNMAGRIFAEWLGSGQSNKTYDALAMISHYRISSALPMLKKYRSRLLINRMCKRLKHSVISLVSPVDTIDYGQLRQSDSELMKVEQIILAIERLGSPC